MRKLKFFEAINEAISQSMIRNNKVIVIGLGSDDPKGIFGTTVGLKKKFGSNRVFDVPTSENAVTGICIGLATEGLIPIFSHQRVEFSLLTIEQIFNQAAKWYFMSAGKKRVPLVIRLIIGRGWGQGPQHSQSLESIFAHIPGLIVVCPSTASDAKGMLISSIKNKNPVIFFEHRWLHGNFGNVPKTFYATPLTKSNLLSKGRSISIISYSFMAIESLKASKILNKYGISCEILDLRCLRPLDKKSIIKTAIKNKLVLIVDNGMPSFGISAEIMSTLLDYNPSKFRIFRMGLAETPIPSTQSLAKYVYPTHISICLRVFSLMEYPVPRELFRSKDYYSSDQPDKNFTGPF